MVIDKIFEEIKKLSPSERYKLRAMLDFHEITEDDIEISKSAAGGWADVNSDKLIKDIYEKRGKGSGRIDAEW